MENRNICKFTTNYDIDKINVICFIYESDTDVMKNEQVLAAMSVSLVIVPLVSAFTKNKDTERIEEIFECYNVE
mgnify:CR=1 FL=1